MLFKFLKRAMKYIPVIFLMLEFSSAYSQQKMNLKACIEYAWKNNISLQQNESGIRIRQFEVKKNKMAYLPSVSAFANTGYSFGYSLDYTSYEYYRDQIQSAYFSMSSDWLLFNGFRVKNQLESSRHGLKSSQYSFQQLKDQIGLTVAFYYLTILQSAERVKFAENQLELTRKLYEKARLMVEVGQETRVKELELKAQLASDELNLTDARNNLEQAYLNLKQVMNYPIGEKIEIEEVESQVPELANYEQSNPDAIIKNAVENLPEVKKAREDMIQAEFNYKATRSLAYPSLTGSGNLNSRYSSAKSPLTGEPSPFFDQMENNFNQSISIGLNIPLFTRLSNAYNIYSAKENINLSRLTYEDVKIKAENTIYEAWFNLQSSIKRYKSAQNKWEAQKALFEQSQLMYDEGVISFYDWQTAKTNLTAAESDFLAAKYDLLYRIKLMNYYTGQNVF